MSRDHLDSCIWIDPGRLGGTPCIGGHRIPADLAARHLWDCGTAKALAELHGGWPDVPDRLWLTSCWYVATFGDAGPSLSVEGWHVWPERWGAWAADAGKALWHSDGPLPPWPPENPNRPPGADQ